MRLNSIFYLLMILISALPTGGYAQQWFEVKHTSGTQILGGRSVTVTPSGSARALYECGGVGPFYIGENYSHDPGAAARPGEFTFEMSRPVRIVKIQIRALDPGELVEFYVNGARYMLSRDNITPFATGCATDQGTVTTINNGALYQPQAGKSGSAEINIVVPEGISLFSFYTNGTRMGNISRVFIGDMEARAVNPCRGDTLKLSGNPETAGAAYAWTGPGGFSSVARNPQIPDAGPAQSGVYYFRIIKDGITYTDTVHVAVKPAPPRPEVVYTSPACLGSALQLAVRPQAPGVTYSWSGPAGFRDTGESPVIGSVTERHSGRYTVAATLGDCTVAASGEVHVTRPVRHTVTATICGSDTWQFNGVTLSDAGVYLDTFRAASGCDSVVMLSLVRLPEPEVRILTPAVTGLCVGDSVRLEAKGAPRYTWYDEAGRELGTGKSVYAPLNGFSNRIVLVGWAGNTCSDTAGTEISAEGCCMLYTPNAFTPNGDGRNDGFGGKSLRPVSEYSLKVFSRWGQLLFQSLDIDSQWDGTFNGAPAEPGTYYYSIQAQCLTGTAMHRSGDLTLIR